MELEQAVDLIDRVLQNLNLSRSDHLALQDAFDKIRAALDSEDNDGDRV